MTRNSDLDCDDLFGCDHEPETPLSDGGVIYAWVCRCGSYQRGADVNGKPEPRRSEDPQGDGQEK